MPRRALAAQAVRKSAPSVGGVKKPHRAYMAVWGKRADMAYRLMLIKAAKKGEKEKPELAKRAREQALSGLRDEGERRRELKRWMERLVSVDSDDECVMEEEEAACSSYSAELRRALFDSEVGEDTYGPWIVTPLRNRMQLRVLQMNGDLEKHPWARFIGWFLQTYVPNGDEAMEAELFSPAQRLVRDGYEVQFMRNEERWSIVMRVRGEEEEHEWFDVYFTGSEKREELCRLEKRVMAAEKGDVRHEVREPWRMGHI
jgi:hypothetical protein